MESCKQCGELKTLNENGLCEACTGEIATENPDMSHSKKRLQLILIFAAMLLIIFINVYIGIIKHGKRQDTACLPQADSAVVLAQDAQTDPPLL